MDVNFDFYESKNGQNHKMKIHFKGNRISHEDEKIGPKPFHKMGLYRSNIINSSKEKRWNRQEWIKQCRIFGELLKYNMDYVVKKYPDIPIEGTLSFMSSKHSKTKKKLTISIISLTAGHNQIPINAYMLKFTICLGANYPSDNIEKYLNRWQYEESSSNDDSIYCYLYDNCYKIVGQRFIDLATQISKIESKLLNSSVLIGKPCY